MYYINYIMFYLLYYFIIILLYYKLSLRKKRPYSELLWLLWSAFPRIQSKCGKMRTIITPNTDTFHAVYNIQSYYKIIIYLIFL